MSKSHWRSCVSFSRTGAGLGIYHLLAWSIFNFLHISQLVTLPTQSYLALYSFCANLLHSHIMWLLVSSLSPHSLHLLFCCVLSILALIWLVFMALSCAAIRRNSVSLLRFPFLSHVLVLSCDMLFMSPLIRPWSCFPSQFCFLVFHTSSSKSFHISSWFQLYYGLGGFDPSTDFPCLQSFSRLLGTVPITPTIIDITTNFTVHSSSALEQDPSNMSMFSLSFIYTIRSTEMAKSTI